GLERLRQSRRHGVLSPAGGARRRAGVARTGRLVRRCAPVRVEAGRDPESQGSLIPPFRVPNPPIVSTAPVVLFRVSFLRPNDCEKDAVRGFRANVARFTLSTQHHSSGGPESIPPTSSRSTQRAQAVQPQTTARRRGGASSRQSACLYPGYSIRLPLRTTLCGTNAMQPLRLVLLPRTRHKHS